MFSFAKKFYRALSQILDFICSFLEMHLVKIVAFSIMALCCSMVNALHLMIVIVILLSTFFGTAAMEISFCFIGLFLGVLYLSKMVYETDFINHQNERVHCKAMNASFHSALENAVLDPVWWGFVELKGENTLISYYKGYIFIFLVMTLKAVIEIRQKIIRIDVGEPSAVPHVMFPEISRKDADKNLKSCIKFLLNYGFYKLGIEITLTFCVFTIALRMDIIAVVYILWVVLLFTLKRSTTATVWPFFLTAVIFSILWQYVMALGFSKRCCYEYPWDSQPVLANALFLPTSKSRPDTNKTLVDFVLLLLIQRQVAVFELEKRYGDGYPGGSNKDIYMNYLRTDFVNPTPDHTGSIRSWLHFAKYIFLSCLFKITLAILFWNGASNANILSLGYLVGAFVFLWIDYNLCLWPTPKILKWWNVLLSYTVCVILITTTLEFARCVISDYLRKNAFWLVELLFLRCENSIFYEQGNNVENINLIWDCACFGLIIFQRKYFQSYYFLHQKEDVLAVFRLQAKGAKLIDDLQESKLKDFQMGERNTLMKIKKKMNRIKAWQKRMQGLNYNEPTDHAAATYMGDYLMFDDEVTSIESKSSSSSSDDDFDNDWYKRQKSKDLTMSQFFGTVLKGLGDEERPGAQETGAEPSKEKKPKTDDSDNIKSTDSKEREREQEPDQTREEKKGKTRKCLRLFQKFLDSVMVSLIRFFNRHSKDYRFIESLMKKERKLQKETKLSNQPDEDESARRSSLKISFSAKSLEISNNKLLSMKSRESSDDFLEEGDGGHKRSSQMLMVKLIDSICMFIMSKTELFCFVIIFLHTVLAPSLISLPLPFLVFLWGSLTTIRPTTTFWTVLIAYTEVTVVIKVLFQNAIFPWNAPEKFNTHRPEYPPMFLGIHQDKKFVIADLFLLLLLFLHRYKLKTLGLWNRTHEEETLFPQNLKVYRVLPSEGDLKDVKGNRSQMNQRRLLTNFSEVISHYMKLTRIATWKCTSRATAAITYWNNKMRTKIKIKEIEGPILVTHEGRRLQPTNVHISQMPEDELEGNVVLRVYVHDVTETKGLFYSLSWVQHFTTIRKFFVQIVTRDWRVSADFYTAMFIFEFIDFLIVFFGYSSFAKVRDLQEDDYFSLTENEVPPLYLFTMIAHFLVIIIDRILYLRKNVVGKLILQFVLVIAVHVWMFIIIPISTESPFNKLPVPQTYYIFCCLYFLMSAYQLRVGYPLRVHGHFLCKKYGYFNFYAYRSLAFIPFFNQLRTILDYLCTHSSLTLTEFIKMESIFQVVFINKCSRRSDIYYPSPRGEECPKCAKYSPTLFVLFGLIIIIWLPFIMFALFNTVAEANPPQEASLVITVGKFGKIYSTTTVHSIMKLTDSQFNSMQSIYKDNRKIWSFLTLFDSKDVALLKFSFQPYEPWIITPEEFNKFNETVQNIDIPLTIYVHWQVCRMPRSVVVEEAKGFTKIVLDKTSKQRKQFADALTKPNITIHLDHVFPKFIHVTNDGEANPVTGFAKNSLRNATVTFFNEKSIFWWKLEELHDDPEEDILRKLPFYSVNETTIYTFNEKNIPKLLLYVSKRGIIGLYLSIVLVMWTITKRFMWKYPYIMFDDMPNPDPVLKLCQDIYLARESHEFALEEDLYAKLLFLFRSPETMIKVTRLNTQNPTPP